MEKIFYAYKIRIHDFKIHMAKSQQEDQHTNTDTNVLENKRRYILSLYSVARQEAHKI